MQVLPPRIKSHPLLLRCQTDVNWKAGPDVRFEEMRLTGRCSRSDLLEPRLWPTRFADYTLRPSPSHPAETVCGEPAEHNRCDTSSSFAWPNHISVRSTTSCAARTKSIATSIQMMLLIASGRLPIEFGGNGRSMCQRHRIATAKSGKPNNISILAPSPFRPLCNKMVRE